MDTDHDDRRVPHEWLVRALDWGMFVTDEARVGDGPAGCRVRSAAALPLAEVTYHRVELRAEPTATLASVMLITAYYPSVEDHTAARIADALKDVQREDHLVFVTRDSPGMATVRQLDCDPVLAAAAVAAWKCVYGLEETFPIRIALGDASWDVRMAHARDTWWTAWVVPTGAAS